MRVLLLRHGSTHAPGAVSTWSDAAAEPALSARGEQEAQQMGQALAPLQLQPAHIWVSPRLRTRQTAAAVCDAAQAVQPEPAADRQQPQTEATLDEINYGLWSGRSNAALCAADARNEAALQAWQTHGRYPADAGFSPTEAQAQAQAQQLLAHVQRSGAAQALLVSHAGRLRFFSAQAEAGRGARRKLSCGHLGILQYQRGTWHLVAWDLDAQAARAFLQP